MVILSEINTGGHKMWYIKILDDKGKLKQKGPFRHYKFAEDLAKRIAEREDIQRTYLVRRETKIKV